MIKLRKISYLLIAIFALNNCSAKLVEINNFNALASSKLGDVKLHHDEYGFYVEQDGELREVQNCFVDKEIRNLTSEELQIQLGNIKKIEIDGQEVILERLFPKSVANFSDLISECESKAIQLSDEESEEIISTLSQSAYIEISQLSDGEFVLHFHPRLPGGGAMGFMVGAWTGKFVVHLVAQAAIITTGVIVSAVATPAAGIVVVAALEKTVAPAVEAASVVVALSAGILAGAATGPA